MITSVRSYFHSLRAFLFEGRVFVWMTLLCSTIVIIFSVPTSAQEAGGELDLRFIANARGGIVFTGNSLTLTPSPEIQKFHRFHDIHFGDVYTSLDPLNQAATYPAGTTRNWRQNGASAHLNLPQGSSVLHAELIWSANYHHTERVPENNVFEIIDEPIRFTTPLGQTEIQPEPAHRKTFTVSSGDQFRAYYVHSVDVTNLVAPSHSGVYSVQGIPGLLSRTNPSIPDNFAGWTLAVAYSHPNYPIKNLTIFSGFHHTSSQKKSNPASAISGFSTPVSGRLQGKIHLSIGEGDGALTGDQFLFGHTQNNLKQVSGPNNQATNFFSSQINSSSGTLDQTGSFGNFNSPNFTTSHISRQGWDITSVDISQHLEYGKQTAFLQGTTNGDSYSINAVGFEIDINAAEVLLGLTVDADYAMPGDILTYTIEYSIHGTTNAQNICIQVPIPVSTEYIQNSTTLNGQLVLDSDCIFISNLSPDESGSITFQVRILDQPELSVIRNNSMASYEYIMAFGLNPVQKTVQSLEVMTEIFTISILASEDASRETPPEAQFPSLNPTPLTMDLSQQAFEELLAQELTPEHFSGNMILPQLLFPVVTTVEVIQHISTPFEPVFQVTIIQDIQEIFFTAIEDIIDKPFLSGNINPLYVDNIHTLLQDILIPVLEGIENIPEIITHIPNGISVPFNIVMSQIVESIALTEDALQEVSHIVVTPSSHLTIIVDVIEHFLNPLVLESLTPEQFELPQYLLQIIGMREHSLISDALPVITIISPILPQLQSIMISVSDRFPDIPLYILPDLVTPFLPQSIDGIIEVLTWSPQISSISEVQPEFALPQLMYPTIFAFELLQMAATPTQPQIPNLALVVVPPPSILGVRETPLIRTGGNLLFGLFAMAIALSVSILIVGHTIFFKKESI